MKFTLVEYNNVEAIEKELASDNNYASVIIEPIQGEKGVIIPNDKYLKKVKEVCEKYKVLLVIDEIQTGFGRTGTLLRCNKELVKPDMVLLGKSLSGGLYPISACLTSKEVMDVMEPGDHGSTYGGNPLAMGVLHGALDEIQHNNMAILDNCNKRGEELGLYLLSNSNRTNKFIKEIRGRGLMFGLEMHHDAPVNAYEVSLMLMERGLLCKPTGKHILRYCYI